jgi:DNA-binding IclR family transcriptional regulator
MLQNDFMINTIVLHCSCTKANLGPPEVDDAPQEDLVTMTDWPGRRLAPLAEVPSDEVAGPAGPETHAEAAGGGTSAVGKALGLLDALGSGRAAEPLSALAARTGMPKSTACRILKMMEGLGFVGRKDSLYCLGPRVLELGKQATVSSHNELRNASLGVLERLYDEVRTTVHLAVLAGSDVLYLEKITAPGSSRIPTRVGLTVPAACTALGKAQLAFSPRPAIEAVLRRPLVPLTGNSVRNPAELLEKLAAVRKAGLAVDREEFRAGLSCVAAPVLVHGRPVAAISASSMSGATFTPQRMAFISGAARRIGAQLERVQRLGS